MVIARQFIPPVKVNEGLLICYSFSTINLRAHFFCFVNHLETVYIKPEEIIKIMEYNDN